MTFRPREGATVGGRFELRERIGGGGFATVWRAVDADGGPVAVKCGRDETHDRETVRAQFRNELRCFRRLDGPLVPGALVQFVDGAVDGDTAYVATELVEGTSLDSLGSPGRDALAAVGRPLVAAVEYLHQCGVVYLDLKPNNVLRRRRGPPALIDFNAATIDDEPAPLFHQDGFKPPELTPPARDRPVGPASDVYALGALLTYLLTGEPDPATATGDGPIDPAALGADPPVGLVDALRTATAPDPADRFADAGTFWAAIATYLGAERDARLVPPDGTRHVRIHPGATIGRWTTDGPLATAVLDDPGGYTSASHATLDYRDGGWFLVDTSLNGTFVEVAGNLAYVVSAEGLSRQREAGRTPPHPDPASEIRLADGDVIVPVDHEDGPRVAFRVG